MSSEITPDRIMELGLSFWGSKAVLSALELGVFTELSKGPLSGAEVSKRIGLHTRSSRDFLDALVALGVLERDGDLYSNTSESDVFLDRDKPSYVGGLLEMANARLYGFWGTLTEALKTGDPQNEIKTGGNFFEVLYSEPDSLRQFLKAMTGLSAGVSMALAEKFPWKDYETFIDIGVAEGALPVEVARAHPHLSGGGFDLPPVKPAFNDYVSSAGLGDRLKFYAGDFFEDPLPDADVLVMGHILHDWNLDEKRVLIGKAYDALPDGGALIVYEALIDDERKDNAFGLLMSLNMLIETQGGFDYTGADCCGWLNDAGFKTTYVEHLAGPDSMAVGLK